MSIYRQFCCFMLVPTLLACGSADPDASAPRAGETSSTSSVAVVSVGEQDVCSSHRWVGVSLTGQCPSSVVVPGAGVWQQTWLTGTVAPSAAALRRHCAYAWQPSSPATAAPDPHVPRLPKEAGRPALAWLHRDCQITAPLGEHVPAVVGVDLNAQSLAQVDAPLTRGAAPNTAPANVQLAVLDTAPSSGGGALIPGRNGHGYSLARLIENVTCPRRLDGSKAGECLVSPEAVLAMPYVGVDVMDPIHGGDEGTPWTLAAAIARTVDDFIVRATDDGPGARKRLILNLSLGWAPQWGGHYAVSPEELKGSIRSAHDAIVHARCVGALVFAAAGNAPGGRGGTGALYPARWEEKPAPTEAMCAGFEGGGATTAALPYKPFPDKGYRPLVYAVGGVDGADDEIRSARSKSMPRLVAPAVFGVGVVPKGTKVGKPRGGSRIAMTPESARVLTGTSVSTALVSAAAQTVWAYRPELPPSQVVDLLVSTGVSLWKPPEHTPSTYTCLGGGHCTQVPRRLSIARAFGAACASGAVRCPTSLPSGPPPAAYEGQVSRLGPASLAALERSCTPLLELDGGRCERATRTPDLLYYATSYAPRIAPQPGDHLCPACHVVVDPWTSSLDAVISIDSRATGDLYAPALLVYEGRSTEPLRIDLSEAFGGVLVPGRFYYLNDVPLDMTSAAIERISTTRVSFATRSVVTLSRGTRESLSVTADIPFAVR